MKILAIETSCDETAIALVDADGGLKAPKFKVLKNLVASQIKIHRPFGGVVPGLAKREHIKNLPILFGKIFGISNFKFPIFNQFSKTQLSELNKIDLIAVTVGPGLEPALWTGINFAENLFNSPKVKSSKLKAKLTGANHLSGHLYSFLLTNKLQTTRLRQGFGVAKQNIFPAIALIISGGHTMLILMKDLAHYKIIGETRDDAVGECFDKVARLLKLPYPGGPEIEKLAKLGNTEAVNFPRPMLNQKNYDFSFSGLKTSVLYYLRDNPLSPRLQRAKQADIAASFQEAAFDVLIKKTLRAVEEFGAKSVMISGGVAANHSLKRAFQRELKVACKMRQEKNKKHVACPILLVTKFPTDNAAMIAAGAYMDYLNKKKYKLIADGNLSL